MTPNMAFADASCVSKAVFFDILQGVSLSLAMLPYVQPTYISNDKAAFALDKLSLATDCKMATSALESIMPRRKRGVTPSR